MHKARKEILKALNGIDVLIEIVDARLPFSSQNPLIAEWGQSKPTIVILGKSDLADEAMTKSWQDYLEREKNILTLTYQRNQSGINKRIVALCQKLAPQKMDSFKAINAMIVGIPNAGKSTLINTLAGKTIAKVGDEPAVTKRQQKIHLLNR